MKLKDKRAENRAKLIDAIIRMDIQEIERLRAMLSTKVVVLKTFNDCLKFTSYKGSGQTKVIYDLEPGFKELFESFYC